MNSIAAVSADDAPANLSAAADDDSNIPIVTDNAVGDGGIGR